MKRSQLTRKPMKRGPSKNSQPHRSKSVYNAYADSHPTCLLCGDPTAAIHHIRRGTMRVDVAANLAALCGDCHDEVHSSESKFAPMTIKILYKKLLCGEFDQSALDRLGTPLMEGWLAKYRPDVNGPLIGYWLLLVEACA